MSKHAFSRLLLAAAPCLTASVAYAGGTVGELEPNDPIGGAQGVAGEVTVHAALTADRSRDLDYFKFYAKAGDVLTLDIDNGWGGEQAVDTIIAIFGAAPDYVVLRKVDDADTLDSGSSTKKDARIDNFVAPTTGYYTVGVSNYPRDFVNGGGVNSNIAHQGDYDLVISGATGPASIKHVAIEIKPGNDEIAPLNLRSRGKIPAAIFGGPDFNALTIDPATLTFGSTGSEDSLARCDWTGTDVNGDGRVDVVCHFNLQDAEFKATDGEGKVHGWTRDGDEFEGSGFLKVVPAKQR